MAGRDIGRARVDEFAVNLVREEEQIVLLHQIADLIHLLAGVEIPRRVVGVADQDAARAFVDELLELLDGRQRESLLDRREHGADHGARRDGEGHVVGVGGLRNDDLVARIQARHEGEQHGLRAARGDDDVVGVQANLVLLVVARELLAQGAVAVAGAVLQNRAVDPLQGVEPHPGRGQVGLSDVQVVYLRAARLGGLSGTSLRIGEAGISSARREILGICLIVKTARHFSGPCAFSYRAQI